MLIDDLINRLLGLGIELGTKDAVKAALQFIGADTSTIDEVYVEMQNRINKKNFSKVPYNERALFLSHCLKDSEKCKAGMSENGIICEECGFCDISKIKQEAEKLGYKVYIVPGGSMVFKIIQRTEPKACVGVACYYELEEAFEKLTIVGMPFQGIPLLKDGCRDTEVEIQRVIDVLRFQDL